MKTAFALLLLTEGRPIMRVPELADLMGLSPRTVVNKIYDHTFPVPTFKLVAEYVAHVEDVAAYVDQQRAEALKAHGQTARGLR